MIRSRAATKEYRENFDRVFEKGDGKDRFVCEHLSIAETYGGEFVCLTCDETVGMPNTIVDNYPTGSTEDEDE